MEKENTKWWIPILFTMGKATVTGQTDWMNWFLSKDADVRNSGPVVFLRSKGLPNEKTGANISDIPSKMSDTSILDASSYSEPTDVTGLVYSN